MKLSLVNIKSSIAIQDNKLGSKSNSSREMKAILLKTGSAFIFFNVSYRHWRLKVYHIINNLIISAKDKISQ